MTLDTVRAYDDGRVSTASGHAIVVGAGMAGLVTARVLVDAFETVTLVERDSFRPEQTVRDGVPQAHHAHGMLEAGRAILEDLFPGYTREVCDAGGVMIDMATEFDYYYRDDFLADGSNELPTLCASRPLFEQIARRRVVGLDRVRARSGCVFTDYLTDDGQATVRGVHLSNEDGDSEQLVADLVVDATGRTSRTPRWLERQGYRPPEVEEVTIDLAYSTVVVERSPERCRACLVGPSPGRPRGGASLPAENDQQILTLFGMNGDHPPTEYPEFLEFAATLPTPEFEHLLAENERVSGEIHHYPFPSNLWRHYERLDRFPDGLLVTGDAIASFNPIYGQGMSVAALDALHLHHALAADSRENLASRFFDRSAETVNAVWRMTVSADFEFPRTEGEKPLGTDLLNWYLGRLIRTGYTDGYVTEAFARVHRLEQAPTTLFRPSILSRVLLPHALSDQRS